MRTSATDNPASGDPHPPVLADWARIFSLTKKEAEDLRLLEAALGAWCIERGIADAAFYADDDGKTRLRLRVGGGDPPPRLTPETSLDGWHRFDLPDTLLLYKADAALEAISDPLLLLLAAGLRISGLKRQLHLQSFQANFRGVELEALYDVGLAIASTLDLDKLSEEILLRAVALLDARRGALYLLEDGHFRLARSLGGEALDSLPEDAIDLDGLLDENSRNGGPEGWIPGCRHLLAVPIEIDGESRGLLVVADKESRRGVGPFPPTDRRTLKLFANQAAIALENAKLHRLALEKERLEREMELAAEIQQQILPKAMPEIPGFEALGWNRPARQVGGDYFDVRPLDADHWGLVVGDVTGKGMPAALLVSTLHSALRLLLDRMELGPELVERLNRHIYESSSSNKFITLLVAALDRRDNQLTYLNAGHNPGLLIRKNGEVEHLSSAGLPLGLLPDGQYGAAKLHLDSGDLVCIYSDGITECEAPDEEELGLDRLIELLSSHRDAPLDDILEKIDCTTVDFAQGQPQGDDQTIVLLRRR